jgi:3-isopropylmalate/(R)-2-methylmalate dehydratase small subunit
MPLSSAVTHIDGRGLVLRGADIDTDRIMPARYLKAVTFEGLERHLFADDRIAANGAHPFDAPTAGGVSVLLANTNFGCGSSREHAPQALYRWGLRVVLAESFGEIFAGNSLAIGLVCATASAEAIAALMARVDEDPATSILVDIDACVVSAGASTWPIGLPASSRHAWLSGEWDATGLLLANYAEVQRVDGRLPYLRTTSKNA